MIKVSAPERLPGHCWFCRSSNRDAFIDTLSDVEIDDVYGFAHGAVYICEDCVTEMASLLGFVRPKELESLKTMRDRLTKRNLELESETAELRQALESIIRANDIHDLDTDSRKSGSVGVKAAV